MVAQTVAYVKRMFRLKNQEPRTENKTGTGTRGREQRTREQGNNGDGHQKPRTENKGTREQGNNGDGHQKPRTENHQGSTRHANVHTTMTSGRKCVCFFASSLGSDMFAPSLGSDMFASSLGALPRLGLICSLPRLGRLFACSLFFVLPLWYACSH
jgi:hypothetical protein